MEYTKPVFLSYAADEIMELMISPLASCYYAYSSTGCGDYASDGSGWDICPGSTWCSPSWPTFQ